MTSAVLAADTRVCICAGAGGVGKTTMAATVALGAAARGLKVAAITIDPAPRLAESLGLESLENEPTRVRMEDLPELAARRRPGGELWAMRLDTRRTLDELVELLLPDEGARRELLGNRVYVQLSNAVAGTQEFTAVAKLYELDRAGEYDLLVLDTPPSRSALDFLDAPDRLTRFLESRALDALLRSTRLGARLFGRGSAVMVRMLGRLTGVATLEDLTAFLASLGEVRGGFRERAEQVRRLLRDPATAFLIVAVPEPGPVDETIFFARKLRAANMRLAGVVVNRVHHDEITAFDPGELSESLQGDLGASLARRVAENLREYHDRVEWGRACEDRLVRTLGLPRVIRVPQLDRDAHDLEALSSLGRFVFADEDEHEQLIAGIVC